MNNFILAELTCSYLCYWSYVTDPSYVTDLPMQIASMPISVILFMIKIFTYFYMSWDYTRHHFITVPQFMHNT